MTISIDSETSQLAQIDSMADVARENKIQPREPEASFKIWASGQALLLAAEELGIDNPNELQKSMAITDPKALEELEMPRTINSVGEALNCFGAYVASYKAKVDQRITAVLEGKNMSQEAKCNVIRSRALNAVTFENYARNFILDEEIFNEMRYYSRLITELLIVADSDAMETRLETGTQSEILSDLVNCGLQNPQALDFVFEAAREFSPKSPEYKTALEDRIRGVKTEYVTFILMSDVETEPELEIAKADHYRDAMKGVDMVVKTVASAKSGRERDREVLLVDTESDTSDYCSGVCVIRPMTNTAPVVTAYESELVPMRVLAGITLENFGIDRRLIEEVRATKTPALVVRIPSDLTDGIPVQDLANGAAPGYNEFLSKVSLEVNALFRAERGEKNAEN